MISPRRELALLALFAALGCGSPQPEQLPPLGEVVVSIDVDAPVPEFVNRLRIDLFDESGRWFNHTDVLRANVEDWPASFSVFTNDELRSRRVLLRARAYLEGRQRDYDGERFEDPAPYVEPTVASTLSELCDNPPLLALGQEQTLRRGTRTLTGTIPEDPPPNAPSDWAPSCGYPMAGGAVAARLEITTAGDYRIETTRVRPRSSSGAGDPVLFIRSDCRDPLSQIACNDDLNAPSQTDDDKLSRIDAHLESGSYTVLAGGYVATPIDITLRADLAANWDKDQPVAPEQQPIGSLPRLVLDGEDFTPAEEPEPSVTIDRLALLTVVPGQRQRANIVLRAACAGQMVRLSSAASNAAAVPSEAETCVDTEGQRAPVGEETLAPYSQAPPESVVGTFAPVDACPKTTNQGDAICIPAGAFVFGSSDSAFVFGSSTVPEHFADMHRFWLDKSEVTVGRWRAAVAKGFDSPNRTPLENNGPLATTSCENLDASGSCLNGFSDLCTFSTSPTSPSREDFPVTCVDWYAARAFCQFQGGDLPTEAEWQYAATKAGRRFETRFPWGDTAPTCDQTVVARIDHPELHTDQSRCQSAGFGPVAVTDPTVMRDTTELGVQDLAGNVAEWALDAFEELDSPCWDATSLTDPVCWEENAPERTVVGGAWSYELTSALGTARQAIAPTGFVLGSSGSNGWESSGGLREIGFRCAYPVSPK